MFTYPFLVCIYLCKEAIHCSATINSYASFCRFEAIHETFIYTVTWTLWWPKWQGCPLRVQEETTCPHSPQIEGERQYSILAINSRKQLLLGEVCSSSSVGLPAGGANALQQLVCRPLCRDSTAPLPTLLHTNETLWYSARIWRRRRKISVN